MKKDIAWREAIIRILEEAGGAMNYKDIASAIEERGLRQNVGVTPASTVSAVITTDIRQNLENAIFERSNPGEYLLKETARKAVQVSRIEDSGTKVQIDDPEEEAGIIQAFGMYWRRDLISWSKPKILGQQTHKAKSVDFSGQIGVYLLHDGRNVVYVGRSADTLGQRLSAHTRDRLNGRWDRFSWFGLMKVTDEGKLSHSSPPATTEILITTLEALLIESLEPPQNRRGGDGFRAVEYLQVEDPSIRKKREEEAILRRLLDRRND